MKLNTNKIDLIYLKKRHIHAFILLFIYLLNILAWIPPSLGSSTTLQDFYNKAVKVHGNKMSYNEFVNKINEIVNDTESPQTNKKGDWLNAFVYDEYGQVVVYGLPHGDFFKTNKGRMFNENNEQGEYKYLGYNKNGDQVTNDKWFSSESNVGNLYKSKEDYTRLTYIPIEGAKQLWASLEDNIREYLLKTKFNDDDYVTKSKTPYSLRDIWSEDFIYKHALIQVEPGISRAASIKLVYRNSHNTITIDPVSFDFSGKITTDKDTYVIQTGQDTVTVTITITANFKNTDANMYLKDVVFVCQNVEPSENTQSLNVALNKGVYEVKFTKTFTRAELSVGEHQETIKGIIKVNSKTKDYKTIPVEKNIKIKVEPDLNPRVTAQMTATPNYIEFKNADIPVSLKIDYGIDNIKDVSKINKVEVNIVGVGTFTKTPTLVGTHTANVKIPKSVMDGKEFAIKSYDAYVYYYMKDGKKLEAYATSAVLIFRNGSSITPAPTPGPGSTPTPSPTPKLTPTPTPIPDNFPPNVKLKAPSVVKVGETFTVRAYASDPDGDPLRYIWDLGVANGEAKDTSAKLWYDIKYADSFQDVQIIVFDTEDNGADDIAVIKVLPPKVEAIMQIDGAFKVNRKITLNDISETPEMYPIVSRTWTITPITSGISSSDIKFTGNLKGETEAILFKKEGQYRIKLEIINSAGYRDSVEKIITIKPDEKPVALIESLSEIYRNPENNGEAEIFLTDMSYSFDNDIISQRIWKYRYDSDNDGDFSDEAWITLNSGNLSTYTLKTKNVGKYEISLTVKESFGQETISAFVSPDDYLSSSTTKIVEVKNIEPTLSFSLDAKDKVDIIIALGSTSYTLDQINQKLDALKSELFNKNADYNISVVDASQATGRYYYDIYDGFTDWGPEQIIGTSMTGYVQYYGLSDPPELHPVLGYVPNYFTDNDATGYSHWDYSSAGVTEENGEIISYTKRYYYESVDTKYEGNSWKAKYERTTYYRERYITDYRIKNKKIFTVIYDDGFLPNNGRIMNDVYHTVQYWYSVEDKDEVNGWRDKYVYLNHNLKGHWSIKGNPEVVSNLDIVFSKIPSFRSDTKKRFIIYISDKDIGLKLNTHSKNLADKQAYFIGVGKSNVNRLDFVNLIKSTFYGGLYIENNDIDSVFNQIADIIVPEVDHSTITSYVLRNEPIQISAYYSDYENDPQFGTLRYIYTHDPNIFENNTGLDSNAGKYLTASTLKFDKTGKYVISVQARDNPLNNDKFDSYRLWSKPQTMTIFVHNAPIADFEYTPEYTRPGYWHQPFSLTYTNTSYDLDHMSLSNKGIIHSKWSYKKEGDIEWIEGQLTEIQSREVYYVKLEVMDMEYAWGTTIKKISYNDIYKDIDDGVFVRAKFRFTENPVYLSKISNTTRLRDIIQDMSYFSGVRSEMQMYPSEYQWTVEKDGQVLSRGIDTVIKNTGTGKYKVTLVACARYPYYYNNGRSWYWAYVYSEPYTQTLTVLDADMTPPTITISPKERLWNKTDVTVNITATDTGGSGVKEIRYLWTYNPNFADAEFKVSTTDKLTLTNSQEGTWYLYAQAIDNASNASPIVKGGPYQIDKTAPTLLDFSVTGEDYKNGNIFWIGRNKSVDINIKAQELLSGMGYTYLRVLHGDNRALHDWTGISTNLNEFNASSYTDIISAERILYDTEKGEYEVRFTLKGLNDLVSPLQYNFDDIVGNTRGYNDSGLYIGVDTIAPEIYATPNQSDLSQNTVTVSVTVSDVGSGVKNTKYIVSASTIKPAASDSWTTVYDNNFNVDITGTGTWYLYIESRDNVGNVSDQKVGPFKVDMTGPDISAVPLKRFWDNEDVNITLTVTEGYSALKEVRYSVTKNIDKVYSGWQYKNTSEVNLITITQDGSWYLHVEAEDILGNVSYTYFGPYQVDRQMPELTMGYVGGARYVSGQNYYARKGDIVTFWMQGIDALSGMWRVFALARDGITDPYRAAVNDNSSPSYGDHTRVRINTPTITIYSGNTLKANFPFEILTSGDYIFNIEGIADDNATFNRHGWVDTGLRLISDNTPPTISYDQPSGLLMGNDIVVNVSALDNAIGSGVANIAYALSRSSSIPSTGWTVVNSDIASVTFPEEGYWYVHVRATDNVGNVSFANRLYEIIFNTPPTITILGTEPQAIYEGDSVSAIIAVDDLQLQQLTLDVTLKDITGTVVWSGSKVVNPVGSSYPSVNIPMVSSISPGRYTIYAVVTDTYGDSDTDDFSFSVFELAIDGSVSHTDLWDANRQNFNLKKSGNVNSPRPSNMFWAGEKFILSASTTAIDLLSDVSADKVYVDILGHSYHTELSSSDGFSWYGDIWDESMVNKWGNSVPEYLTFRFTVEYSNGTVKTDEVEVIIDNRESYYKLHQIW